jgi:prepilin-type N-terminal cleavage/methylation domain-containing protein
MTKIEKAFTLIELMVVCVIIALLAMLASTAYFGAMQTARAVKTNSTISKLDAAISDIYESYEFRFEHIEDALDKDSQAKFKINKDTMSEIDMVRLKRSLMYDLMRMEMPTTRVEVSSDPEVIQANYKLEPPAVKEIYKELVSSPSSTNLATESAELLYLIIANLDPEALENFTASEIGDTDHNGLLEFIDGWGRPIAFIRFAPGFTDTDRQPDLIRILNSSLPLGDKNLIDSLTPDQKVKIINQWQDPFDPDMLTADSWFLYPVIVSAGRDGLFGIDITRTESELPVSTPDPFSDGASIGVPSGDSGHFDNIHNHSIFR